MFNSKNDANLVDRRKNESGAALITVVLVAVLLIVAGTSILLTTSLFSGVVTDSVSEQQAYYAAESGLQSTINVLRGNVAPNPSFGSAAADRMDFRKAVQLTTSNTAGDSSTFPRLSRWMPYNQTFADRVILGDPNTPYAPITGSAYSVSVSDPDITNRFTLLSAGVFASTASPSKTWGSGANTAKITFVANATTNLETLPNGGNSTIGTFRVEATGTGAVFTGNERFAITVNVSSPFNRRLVMRGTIKPPVGGGIITPGSSNVSIVFDSRVFNYYGGSFELSSKTYATVAPNSGGETQISVVIKAPEPERLVVRSTGFGPRGSRKEMELLIRSNILGNLVGSAAVTLNGPSSNASSNFLFETGDSNGRQYSGVDACVGKETVLPAFGVTSDTIKTYARTSIVIKNNTLTPIKDEGGIENISAETPDWYATTYNLDQNIRTLREIAKSEGTYFASGQTPTSLGNYSTQKGVTFIDGNADLSQQGGGILVVTGKLNISGGFNFKGIVIVTGAEGLKQSGGGSARIEGNLFILPYNPNDLAAGYNIPPKFEKSGGGSSEIIYNSCAVLNALDTGRKPVIAVAEK
jgi:hypothetical protein